MYKCYFKIESCLVTDLVVKHNFKMKKESTNIHWTMKYTVLFVPQLLVLIIVCSDFFKRTRAVL